MSSPGGVNGGGLNSDDQSKKVTGDLSETVSSPVSLSAPCEDVRTDENLVDLNDSTFDEDDQNLLAETIMRTDQTSLDNDAKIYLADIQEENQQLFEEVLKQTKKTNTALAKQSELYDKLILGASQSTDAEDFRTPNSPDTEVKLGGKRLLGEEETSEARSKKMHKSNSEEDPSSEDQKD